MSTTGKQTCTGGLEQAAVNDPYSVCFSFAIVLWEIFSRKLPWADVKTTWSIRDKVENGERPVPPKNTPPELVSLMSQCWANDPAHRPTFQEILDCLQGLDVKHC